MRISSVAVFVLALACGSSGSKPQTVAQQSVVVCPEGSVFDSNLGFCIAKGQSTMVPPAPPPSSTPIVGRPTSTPPSAVPTPPPPPTAPPPVVPTALPPPPQGSMTVDVTCAFPSGWVAVMPASAYPRDDQFLMQALIGFNQDPSFWNGLSEYAAIKRYAAKRCTASPTRFVVSGGDTWVLAGQEGTFSTKGAYDKNGVKQKMSVTSSTTVTLTPASLTHTWLCISCPWVAFSDGAGGALDPFVVLAYRDSRERRGRERRLVRQVPVRRGRIALRVMEREAEQTRLDELVLVIRDGGVERVVFPALGGDHNALAKDDGVEVRMSRGTAIEVDYDVSSVASEGTLDVELVTSGYYVPDAP